MHRERVSSGDDDETESKSDSLNGPQHMDRVTQENEISGWGDVRGSSQVKKASFIKFSNLTLKVNF